MWASLYYVSFWWVKGMPSFSFKSLTVKLCFRIGQTAADAIYLIDIVASWLFLSVFLRFPTPTTRQSPFRFLSLFLFFFLEEKVKKKGRRDQRRKMEDTRKMKNSTVGSRIEWKRKKREEKNDRDVTFCLCRVGSRADQVKHWRKKE